MSQLEPNTKYIYEKADGVTYARKFGGTEKIVIGYDHNITEHKKELEELELWREISKTAKTNKALQKAVDRVKMLYRLSKDDPL